MSASSAEVDRRSRDPILWLGLAGALALGAALRLPAIGAHLPQIVHPDEPTTMTRALDALTGDLTIPFWDWPPLGAFLLAGGIGVAPGVSATSGDATLYLFGRLFFALISLALVAATAWLAVEVLDDRAERRAVATVASLAVAASFLAVRLGRIVHPEQLQILLLVMGLALIARAARRERPTLVVLAGGVLGLAAAAKYLGGVGMVSALWIAVVVGDPSVRARVGRVAAVGAAFLGGILVGTFGTILRIGDVWEGVSYQLLHQTGGHLGYGGPPWVHLTNSLPGNWGWPLTVLGIVGLGYAFVGGDRRLRVLAWPAVLVLALAVSNDVRFPHYVLLAVPLLAILGLVALWRLVRRLAPSGRGASFVSLAFLAIALSLIPTVLDDVRLIRSDRSPDTRELLLQRLPDDAPVLAESSALRGQQHAWGLEPGILDCDCYAVISSYNEDRFREDPQRYDDEIDVYDRMRAEGDVLAVIEPFRPLSYRWDVLPQWGLDHVPLTGEVGATGPTLTIVDLTG
ncbi:MAG: glycosyltransferase family 39 protein [Actinobacteria bacterium]|nr:glycosyltransferase family 39 protein [Actinomycetota bacterium]